MSRIRVGASEFVTKPSRMLGANSYLAQVGGELIRRIKALVSYPGPHGATPATGGTATPAVRGDGLHRGARPQEPQRRVRVVVIGASMGGPEAVSRVLSDIPWLPVPVVVVQHIPPYSRDSSPERLDHRCTSTVLESAGGIVVAVQCWGPVDFASQWHPMTLPAG